MKPPRLIESSEACTVEGSDFTAVFSPSGGVFPAVLGFVGEPQPLVQTGDWRIEWQEGETVYQPSTQVRPRVVRIEESVLVYFDGVPFARSDGTTHPDLRISLEYEIFRDGTGFCVFLLHGEDLKGVEVGRLSLRLGFSPLASWNTDWAFWQFPGRIDGSDIQTWSRFERKIPAAESRDFPGEIAPFVSFDAGDDWRRTHHIEFFLESADALSNTTQGLSTRVGADSGRLGVTWNLQDSPWQRTPGRAIFYRNTFGFCLTRTPRALKRPPLRIYHYFDNFRRYPSEGVIADIRQAGADTLILHENWRLDIRNGEFPADEKALRATLEACHRHGLRCGFYFRGNDNGIRERNAEFLAPYFRKNWDGLYLDYGTPFTYLGHEEFAPGGRLHFREYHRVLRKLRAFVGEDGFLLSHSGSFFAALAHADLDGYFGGEQEKGRMLESREHHAYFAGLAVAPAYWWTAAFPIYRSPRAVAMMAATLHAPVAHLGMQFPSSSLHQPPSPAANAFARRIWALWGFMDHRGPVQVRDTHRSPEAFECVHASVAPAAFWDQEGNGLITAANLSAETAAAGMTLREKTLTGSGEKFLIPLRWVDDHLEADAPKPWTDGRIPEVPVAPYEVLGWLVTADPSAWEARIREAGRSPVWLSEETAEWTAFVEEQRKWREEAPPWADCYFQLSFPNWPNTYEDSIWVDLFHNDLVLEALQAAEPQTAHRLGFIDRQGLHPEVGGPEDRLLAQDRSPWVHLGKALAALPSDVHPTHFRLAARKDGSPFYLFFRICLSPEPALTPESRTLEFCVDLDEDWSALVFSAGARWIRPGVGPMKSSGIFC